MNRTRKTLELIAGEIIFADTDLEPQPIKAQLPNNYVEIVSLDAEDGVPVIPTAGTYTIYAQQVEDGNFLALASGVIDATKSGGSAMADGTGEFVSFVGVPRAIKVVAAGVDVATHARITVSQIPSL